MLRICSFGCVVGKHFILPLLINIYVNHWKETYSGNSSISKPSV
jgi:hypothetical protein